MSRVKVLIPSLRWFLIVLFLSTSFGCGGVDEEADSGEKASGARTAVPSLTADASSDSKVRRWCAWCPTLLKTAAGAPNGTATSATIGTAGGTLISGDGRVRLVVPAGALASDTALTITPVTNIAENALASYRLTPDGTTFSKSVTLSFNVPEAGVSTTAIEGMAMAIRTSDGGWRWLPTSRDAINKVLSVRIPHFSEYSTLRGWMLSPQKTSVKAGGKTVPLQILWCTDAQSWQEMPNQEVSWVVPLDPDVYECRPNAVDSYQVGRWFVNAIEGGNPTVGRIAVSGTYAATYTSPTERPDPSRVTAIVEIQPWKADPKRINLLSEITILKDYDYWGEFTARVVQTDDTEIAWTAQGDAAWRKVAIDALGPVYEVEVNVYPDQTHFTYRGDSCVLVTPEHQVWTSKNSRILTSPVPGLSWAIWAWWDASCTDSEGTVYAKPNLIGFSWRSGCLVSPGVGTYVVLDPSVFPGELKGEFTNGGSIYCVNPEQTRTATVRWSFAKSD